MTSTNSIYNPRDQCPDPHSLPLLKKGDRGKDVKLLQEWLSLRDFSTTIDGDFGPATFGAVQMYARSKGLGFTDLVSTNIWVSLLDPMIAALSSTQKYQGIREAIVFVAERHLNGKPREVGGENRGPWVRLYMDGLEGDTARWCAGFNTFVVYQAANQLENGSAPSSPSPLPPRTFSCDVLARVSMNNGRFLIGGTRPTELSHGDLFVVRGKARGDWIHTGIVWEAAENHVVTIEGNTNTDGSPEGYMVARRTRSYRNLDFIRVA